MGIRIFAEFKSKIKGWSVWVGGTEVNDYYLTYERAKEIHKEYTDEGYDDVKLGKIHIEELILRVV